MCFRQQTLFINFSDRELLIVQPAWFPRSFLPSVGQVHQWQRQIQPISRRCKPVACLTTMLIEVDRRFLDCTRQWCVHLFFIRPVYNTYDICKSVVDSICSLFHYYCGFQFLRFVCHHCNPITFRGNYIHQNLPFDVLFRTVVYILNFVGIIFFVIKHSILCLHRPRLPLMDPVSSPNCLK